MILVDGHNLIGRSNSLSLEEEEQSRAALLSRIWAQKGHKGEKVVVVFDGNRPRGNAGEKTGSVGAFYTPSGKSADDEIIRRVDSANSPASITVVTSDRELAARAKSRGAKVKSAEEFWRALSKSPSQKSPCEKPAPSNADAAMWLEIFAKKK